MFERIMVPLDGSARAEQAVPVAARIARASDGTVILAQVATSHTDSQAGRETAGTYSDDGVEELRALATNYLDTVSKVAELVGVKTETRVAYGDVAPSILGAVEALGVDLIVMSSHGYTGLKRWVLGSVAHKIIPHSAVPVLVLRDGGTTLASGPVYALVTLDGSPLAESVLAPVVQLVAALAPSARKTLHLVRVVDLPVAYGKFAANAQLDQMREDAKSEAYTYLGTVAERLTGGDGAVPDLTVTTSIAVNLDVAEALVQMTGQELHAGGHFDLVAMATRGRGGLQRWMMGSVTERVLQATRLPMLVVHPTGNSERTRERNEPGAS